MNKQQHIFIWIGISLLTFMAIAFDSKLVWVVAAIALIGECVFICKSKQLSTAHWILLISAIVMFLIALLSSLPRQKLNFLLGPERHRSRRIGFVR